MKLNGEEMLYHDQRKNHDQDATIAMAGKAYFEVWIDRARVAPEIPTCRTFNLMPHRKCIPILQTLTAFAIGLP